MCETVKELELPGQK